MIFQRQDSEDLDSVFIINVYPCLLVPVTRGHVFLARTSHTHTLRLSSDASILPR